MEMRSTEEESPVKPTVTETKILRLLSDGCYLWMKHGRESVPIFDGLRCTVGWTTKKTVRRMVAKGLLTHTWELPPNREEVSCQPST